jgi:extracellular factor (EF) 3-hydroxypalmitic acid methyl ester biosynthesis protein
MRSPQAITDDVGRLARGLVSELREMESALSRSADPESLYPRVAAALDRCLGQLAALNLWGPENRIPSSELWNVAGHLLERGWLQNRARTKPRGYAGDYEMLARIYEGQLCDDPLGRLFDRYFQEQVAPQAVRNRMRMMTDWIIQFASSIAHHSPFTTHPSLHIAILGSAFGLEVRDALRQFDSAQRERIHVTLLDLDPAAIDFARQQLEPLMAPERLTAQSDNLFRLTDRPQTASLLDEADLLFCPGLFDYLDDAAAAAMLRVLYQRLAPGGRLTVFQFAPNNPTRAYMEWLANWYLVYRDSKQLSALAQSAGIPANSVQFGAEPLRADLYLTVARSK